MSVYDDLATQFETLNVAVDDNVLVKCGEICLAYSISPEDFIDQWLAYSASKSYGLAPTLDALDRLERHEFKRQPAAPSTATTPLPESLSTANTPQPAAPSGDPQSERNDVSAPVRTPVRQNLQRELFAESPLSHNLPTQNFGSRPDSGATMLQFGDNGGSFGDWPSDSSNVKIVNSKIGKTLYMHHKFLGKLASLDTISGLAIADIIDHHKLELSREKYKQFSGELVMCGRVVAEGLGKLDHNSILLEGPVDFFKGERVKLSLNKVQRTRLFPGQGVVVTGNNRKDWFTVKEIYAGAPIPGENCGLEETVRILAAAGPFTVQENLLYEPLEHLLKHVDEFKPNVLLLMGPFLDSDHPHFENLNEFYETFFENIINGVMEQLQETKLQVVLVPSHRDIHCHAIFPTYPYELKRRYENVHLAPNPFILDIDGLIIGGSTADVIFHLGKTEFSKGSYDDRIGQLVTHIFNQRNFYPLYPPDRDIRVDYELLRQFGRLETAPHVMILPSNFRNFVKVVEGCVVINPERLTKGNSGGTFAKIEVRAGPKDSRVSDRVSCLVQKV